MPTASDEEFAAELREHYCGHSVRIVRHPWVWPDASDVVGVLERVEDAGDDYQLIVRVHYERIDAVFVHDVAAIALIDGTTLPGPDL